MLQFQLQLHLRFLPLLRSPLHQLPHGPSVFLGLELVLGPSVFLGLGPIVFLGLGPSVFLGLGPIVFLGLGPIVFLVPIVLVLVPIVLILVPIVLGLVVLGPMVFLGLELILGPMVLGLAGLVLRGGSSPPNTAIWSVYCVSGNSNTQKNISTCFRSFIYCYSLYIYLNLFLYGDKLININSNCELRLICFKINAPHRDRTCDLVVNSDAL